MIPHTQEETPAQEENAGSQFAQTKRFLEYLRADPTRAPKGDATPIEQEYTEHTKALLRSRETMRTGGRARDERLGRWRDRQLKRVRLELGEAKSTQIVHAPYAIELARGCSVGCWSCGVSAPKLSDMHAITGGFPQTTTAMALVTYYNGVQPLVQAFDGFFVHSRASFSLPLVGPGEFADLAGGLGGLAAILRTDARAPVIELQAEGDLTGLLTSALARQPDSDTFRLWEVAGTAHADAHLLGPIADLLDCGVPVNDAPLHIVAKAALRALDTWVRTGAAPAAAPRLGLTTDTPPAILRDADGIGVGGIRTPPIDVPVDVLSGAPGPSAEIICLLLGSTTPLPPSRIAGLYSSTADYEQQYRAAADDVIARGFVLEEDRDALMGYASPSRISE